MTCDKLKLNANIFDCRKLDDGTIIVGLSVTLPGGIPVYVFVERFGDTYIAKDDGDTLAYARSIGVGFCSKFVFELAHHVHNAGARFFGEEIVVIGEDLSEVINRFIHVATVVQKYIETRMAA